MFLQDTREQSAGEDTSELEYYYLAVPGAEAGPSGEPGVQDMEEDLQGAHLTSITVLDEAVNETAFIFSIKLIPLNYYTLFRNVF